MSDFWCKVCDQYKGFPRENHKCPPKWYVYAEEYEGYDTFEECTRTYFGDTAEAAAIKWAERYDNGDYTLADGSEITVRVRAVAADDSTAQTFVVSAEQRIEYLARETTVDA